MPKNREKDSSFGQGKSDSVADRYYGIVKVEKWPEDLDEYFAKQITENLLKKLKWPSANRRDNVSGN